MLSKEAQARFEAAQRRYAEQQAATDANIIEDIEGILYFKDTPIIEFKIVGRTLEYAKDLSDGRYYPHEFHSMGLVYRAFQIFFKHRAVSSYAQDIDDYLEFMGLDHYDFNEIVKKMNGWNSLGLHWVRFPDKGAKCWNDILTQKYPIY